MESLTDQYKGTEVSLSQTLMGKAQGGAMRVARSMAFFNENDDVEAMVFTIDGISGKGYGTPLSSVIWTIPKSLRNGEVAWVEWKGEKVGISIHHRVDDGLIFLQGIAILQRVVTERKLKGILLAEEARTNVKLTDRTKLSDLMNEGADLEGGREV